MSNNEFNYSYSAKEKIELKRIREKYLSDTSSDNIDKMEQIRRLDASVTKKGTVISLVIGIIGALVMGFGMSLIMTDLRSILASYVDMAMVIGIIIGFIGMILVIVAYPIYQRITEKQRKKIAPEIIRLSDELINESK